MRKRSIDDTLRVIILNQINSNFCCLRGWLESQHYDHALEYQIKSQALIELLEVDDCGSIGGYDEKVLRRLNISSGHYLFDRFILLVLKYHEIDLFDGLDILIKKFSKHTEIRRLTNEN